MVKIITDILFEEELDKYLDDAYEQYGQKKPFISMTFGI